ncbi:hypothetical protein RJG79_08495 [Mycoplasmatota bacterium WC44]
MCELFKVKFGHLRINKNLYVVYSAVTISFLLIIYSFFHGDLSPYDDVVAIFDLGYIAIYQLISLPILSFAVMNKGKLRKLRKLSDKSLLVGAENILIPMIIVFIFPLIYCLFNYKSFVDLHIGIKEMSNLLIYFLIGFELSLFIQYYCLIHTFNLRDRITKFKPIMLLGMYVVVYVLIDIVFNFYYNYDELGVITYFEYLHIFENITYGVLGILSLILVCFLLDLYKKVQI